MFGFSEEKDIWKNNIWEIDFWKTIFGKTILFYLANKNNSYIFLVVFYFKISFPEIPLILHAKIPYCLDMNVFKYYNYTKQK